MKDFALFKFNTTKNTVLNLLIIFISLRLLSGYVQAMPRKCGCAAQGSGRASGALTTTSSAYAKYIAPESQNNPIVVRRSVSLYTAKDE